MRTAGGDAAGGDAPAEGGSLEGGDPALMGGHTGPTAEGAEYAQGAQDRAKAGREAQQRQLAARTGDTLYPASGKPSSQGLIISRPFPTRLGCSVKHSTAMFALVCANHPGHQRS